MTDGEAAHPALSLREAIATRQSHDRAHVSGDCRVAIAPRNDCAAVVIMRTAAAWGRSGPG
jgi:hypothetical protein